MTALATSRLERLKPLFACPGCRNHLDHLGETLKCQVCQAKYPLVQGRPVFVPAGCDVRVVSEGHVSNQPPERIMKDVAQISGWVLNLGAGGTQSKVDHVVEVEYALFRNTDVSADAHHLPFKDNCFDAVITFNTFEHLSDPPRAAAEVYRVLKPGGKVILHTAFLQPLHESPYHFYNTTEWGLRKWFQQFQIEAVQVSDNFHPGYVLAWLSHLTLYTMGSVGPDAERTLSQTTLEYWAKAWSDPKTRDSAAWKHLATLSQDLQKMFAAGFELIAKKPG
jgi:SAM-dependent methyltransferase